MKVIAPLAGIGLAISLLHALYQYTRLNDIEKNLLHWQQVYRTSEGTLRKEITERSVLQAEVASAPRRQFTEKLHDLIQTAEKGPGGVPLLTPSDLFGVAPELKRSYLIAAANQRRIDYSTFMRMLDMSKEKADAFWRIIETREEAWVEAETVASRTTNQEGSEKQKAEISSNAEAQLRDLLGQDYHKLQDYRRSSDTRKGLVPLMTLSNVLGSPLSFEQFHEVSTIAADCNLIERSANVSPKFDTARENAEKILAPQQMAAFDMFLDQLQIRQARLYSN